jgi:hypothetical protein
MAVFTNRVFDAIDADFVEWDTAPAPDPTGIQYTGSGTFGIDTSDYTVLRKVDDVENFSWKHIPLNKDVTIPTGQQMLLSGGITIDGSLTIDGELVFI